MAGSGGSPDGGGVSSGVSGMAGAGGSPAMASKRVLVYTKATGFVHESTPMAAAAISQAVSAAGLLPELSEDPGKFAPAQLAQYAALVLLATTGEPFGSPGTTQIQTLVAYVKNGGALVAIENANHAYDDSVPYISLIGADFNGHPAFGPDTCYTAGDHPSVAMLPASFPVVDEIYEFTQFNPLNQVVLRCGADKRPISWVREEGAGRVFYTALGHDVASWTKPPLVAGHVLPGLLWTLKQ